MFKNFLNKIESEKFQFDSQNYILTLNFFFTRKIYDQPYFDLIIDSKRQTTPNKEQQLDKSQTVGKIVQARPYPPPISFINYFTVNTYDSESVQKKQKGHICSFIPNFLKDKTQILQFLGITQNLVQLIIFISSVQKVFMDRLRDQWSDMFHSIFIREKQPDKKLPQTEQDYLDALSLSKTDINNFDKIKQNFREKIRKQSTTKHDRIRYNLAYEYLCNKLFKVEESADYKSFIEAIYKGDMEYLKNKIKSNPKIVNFRKQKSNYPLLYFATRSGHEDVVQFILKNGSSLNFTQDRSTPLHCAVYYGFDHIIPILIKYGIPANIKNSFKHLPEDQAYKDSTKKILKTIKSDLYHQLLEKLTSRRLAVVTLNLSFNNSKQTDVRKILLNGYFKDHSDFEDGFHGTNYYVLDSIAINGLLSPGKIAADGKKIQVVKGHIQERVKLGDVENWANAIFVSPSMFYAGNSVYSKTIKIEGQDWCPIVQVKVRKGKYTSRTHTLIKYDLAKDEPQHVEYRVEFEDSEESVHQQLTRDSRNVRVVAIMLIRNKFLIKQKDYNKVRKFILESSEQIFCTKNLADCAYFAH